MGAGRTPIIRQARVEDRGQRGGISAVGGGGDVTGAEEDHTTAAKRLRGGQPTVAKQVEVVGRDHATAELVDLCGVWRDVASDEGAVEDNDAREVETDITAIHTAALQGSCIARDGAADKDHFAKTV